MKKYTVAVTQYVEVEIDETKFDETFMEEFRDYMYQFDTIEEHVEHLAQLEARGLIDFDNFVEGYGDIKDMNITIQVNDWETTICN